MTLSRVTLIAAMLALLVFVLNAALIVANRNAQDALQSEQAALSAKNLQINANNTFANISQNLIQALGNAAVTRKDDQIRALLTQNGVTIDDKANAAKAAAPAK